MSSLPVERPKIVILGTGFGAFSLIQASAKSNADVTVISPRNHFLFTPLLASTTVGTLEFRSVIESVRLVEKGAFHLARAETVDMDNRCVSCRGELDGYSFSVPFDWLIVAVGAATQTFGVPGVAEHALFLKQINDARTIRQRILECLERASLPGLPDAERKRLLHFVVVGGGPTGVEFAAELHDLWSRELRKAYAKIAGEVRITLLEAGKQLLNSYDGTLSEYTRKRFARQAIDVRTETPVVRVEAEKLTLKDGSELPYGCLVWATGNASTAFVKGLPAEWERDKHGRLLIDERLAVAGADRVFALGDCSALREHPVPATAQAAEQQGAYLAKALPLHLQGRPCPPFQYKHQGMLAYVGGHSGIADMARFKGRGFAAFLFWRLVYLTKLVSLRNKMMVLADWSRAAVFGREISRF
jgi:NADH:ubiquinone reductase (non-electrogenic)